MNTLKVDDYHLVHDKPDNNRDLDMEPLHSLIEIIDFLIALATTPSSFMAENISGKRVIISNFIY